MNKLIETIAQQRGDFTKSERKIAEYILGKPLDFAVSSVGGIAERLGVSNHACALCTQAGF